MAKNSIRDFSATAASNTDIQSVDIDENCAASGINNAIRELMADIKDVSAGTVALETPQADGLTIGTSNLDMNGNELILDADADTSITADTDDQIDVKIGGADEYSFTATALDLNGNELVLDADGDSKIEAGTDDTINIVSGGTTAINIDSNGFSSGLMYSAGRQSLASSNGYTWTGIPSTAKRIIVVYRLYFTQSSSQDKSTILRVGDGSIVTSGYENVSTYQYASALGSQNDASGFHTFFWSTGTQNQFGRYELTYLDGNGWVMNGSFGTTEFGGTGSQAVAGTHNGYINLTGALDRVQLKIKDGTTTYNANSEAVLYYIG